MSDYPDGPNPLGRFHIPDPRDTDYPITEVLGEAELRGWRYWFANGWWGDQLYTPQCVAYSFTHWLEDGPRTTAPYSPQHEAQHELGAAVSPKEVYTWAQNNDEWPGKDYEGTSVRAGAKALRNLGYISSFRWATSSEETAQTVLAVGPVIAGTSWLRNMTFPDENGMIDVSGKPIGGHAYLINGVNTDRRIFRIKNSWGRGWGLKGHAYISFELFDSLLADHGEVCVPLP